MAALAVEVASAVEAEVLLLGQAVPAAQVAPYRLGQEAVEVGPMAAQ